MRFSHYDILALKEQRSFDHKQEAVEKVGMTGERCIL